MFDKKEELTKATEELLRKEPEEENREFIKSADHIVYLTAKIIFDDLDQVWMGWKTRNNYERIRKKYL